MVSVLTEIVINESFSMWIFKVSIQEYRRKCFNVIKKKYDIAKFIAMFLFLLHRFVRTVK